MKKRVIKICIYSALILFLLYAYRFKIIEFINDKFYGEYVIEELDSSQKLEDFDAFYTTIVESVPFLDESAKLYGINFKERYEYYRDEIVKTENNFEFYCVMEAIGEEIPSFHTELCFPLYSNLRTMNCYNSRQTIFELGRQSKIEAWKKTIEEGIKQYKDVAVLGSRYVDGKYIVDEVDLPECYENMKGYELIQIDGKDVDEYVIHNLSIFNRYYDYANDKPYRKYCVFNNEVGKQVCVLWEKPNGDQVEMEMYINYGAEVVFGYEDIFETDVVNGNTDVGDIVVYTDEINELEYIAINNFVNSEGEFLKKYLKKIKYDTVVIDLRDNYGGYIQYAQEYIYPALYSEDVTQSYEWLVPNSESNQCIFSDWRTKLKYESAKDENAHYYQRTVEYKGKAKNNKNVYYLVGPGTGSAADTYIAMIKENNLGTIVGSSTGGEGLGDSYVCSSLKHSSLVYVYYPSIGFDENTNETIYGVTLPDVFVDRTEEEYSLWRSMLDEGEANTYENRLLHDAVLKWVIENVRSK